MQGNSKTGNVTAKLWGRRSHTRCAVLVRGAVVMLSSVFVCTVLSSGAGQKFVTVKGAEDVPLLSADSYFYLGLAKAFAPESVSDWFVTPFLSVLLSLAHQISGVSHSLLAVYASVFLFFLVC